MTDSTRSLQILIERFNAGDQAVRNELIAIMGRRLSVACRRMLRGDRLRFHLGTDDLLQETLLGLDRELLAAKVTDASAFLRLGAVLIRRRACDFARRVFGPRGVGANELRQSDSDDLAQRPLTGFVDPCGDDPRLLAVAAEKWLLFHAAVENLPESDRIAFELCWYERLSPKEAAMVLDVDERTIRNRLNKARIRLGALLRGSGAGEGT